jgi:HSP20 family protein
MCDFAQPAAAYWGTLRRVEVIAGENKRFAGGASLAQSLRLLSAVIRSKPSDITPLKRGEETMKPQQAIQPAKQETPHSPIFVEAEKLFEQMKEFSQSVARRAYGYFEARGREFGHDLEDWFRAESELMRRVPIEVREINGRIIMRVEIPGFAANEIKISVEPRRLVISGKAEEKAEEKNEQTLLSEFRPNQFCREMKLPVEVDPPETTAVLNDGVLELTLAKAAEIDPVNVEAKTE